MSLSNVWMSVIHWQFCPPVQSPCAYVFCKRVREVRNNDWCGMKVLCDVRQDHHTVWHTGPDGRDTTPGCRNSFQLLSDMYNRHLQLRPEERKHSSQGRVSVPVSLRRVPSDEVSLQGAGFPQLSTQGYLGKVAFQTADTPQTSSGAQVRQVTAGTWGWCLGHTTCLQPGPKVALESSEAQKQTPSWHLLCKAKGYQLQAVKFRNRQSTFPSCEFA